MSDESTEWIERGFTKLQEHIDDLEGTLGEQVRELQDKIQALSRRIYQLEQG